MSRVYEALRQKRSERTHDPLGSTAGNQGFQDEDAGAAITSAILETVFESEEERPGVPEKIQAEDSLPSALPRNSHDVSTNGFRRMSLEQRAGSRLVFQTDRDGLAAEQFRFLRRTLEQKFPNGAVLLVTSPAPQDGKTLTSINLSACLSDSGRATLLMEADIRQPSVQKTLGSSSEAHGIEEALAGALAPKDAVACIEELGLCVSTVGHPPADPSRIITGRGTQQFLKWARERFHWVVVDSPPVLPAADVAHLAALADAVLLVVRAQSTPKALVTRALEILGDRLYGVVLNEATIESNPYYRYLTEYKHSGNGSSAGKS